MIFDRSRLIRLLIARANVTMNEASAIVDNLQLNGWDFTLDPEDGLAVERRDWTGSVLIAANPGFNSTAGVQNRSAAAGPGVTPTIVVVQAIGVAGQAVGDTMNQAVGRGALITTNSLAPTYRDTRWIKVAGQIAVGVALIWGRNTAAVLQGTAYGTTWPLNTLSVVDVSNIFCPQVLGPGDWIEFANTTVNEQFKFFARGYELEFIPA